jgi:hypothetical protein
MDKPSNNVQEGEETITNTRDSTLWLLLHAAVTLGSWSLTFAVKASLQRTLPTAIETCDPDVWVSEINAFFVLPIAFAAYLDAEHLSSSPFFSSLLHGSAFPCRLAPLPTRVGNVNKNNQNYKKTNLHLHLTCHSLLRCRNSEHPLEKKEGERASEKRRKRKTPFSVLLFSSLTVSPFHPFLSSTLVYSENVCNSF